MLMKLWHMDVVFSHYYEVEIKATMFINNITVHAMVKKNCIMVVEILVGYWIGLFNVIESLPNMICQRR